jgi:PDZ domain-containing protein
MSTSRFPSAFTFARVRRTAAALGLAAWPLLALPAGAQELPPPEAPSKKPTPRPPRKPGAGQPSAPQQAQPAAASLLLSTDLPCTVTINGTQRLKLAANATQSVSVSPGQHLLSAVSEDGRLKWEKIVETKGAGQQTVVKIELRDAAGTRLEDFDRAAARVWLAVTDLKVAGAYASSILDKAWGFHNQDLSTALFTAHEFLKREVEDFKKFTTNDAPRKRFLDDMVALAGTAEKYVDLLTKAISAAQQANSWMGEPNNMYAQARALERTMVLPTAALETLRASQAFKDALPVDRQVRAGLSKDPRDFELGADYYASTPRMLAVVHKKGLASDLGFKAGDVLVSVNGRPAGSVWDLKVAMRESAGRKVTVVVEREGRAQSREIKVPGSLPQ